MKRLSILSVATLLLLCGTAVAQAPGGPGGRSSKPQVGADGRVTFRVAALEAQSMSVNIGNKDYPMTKGENGVWTVTTDPQVEGFHFYALKTGGLTYADPNVRA